MLRPLHGVLLAGAFVLARPSLADVVLTKSEYIPPPAAFVDFDGDGVRDQLVVGSTGTFPLTRATLAVALGDGHGGFVTQPAFDVAPGTNGSYDQLETIDMTGDGRTDLLVVSRDRFQTATVRTFPGGGGRPLRGTDPPP